MKNKIGIGIVTTGREDFFKQCMLTLPGADYVVVIHNGDAYNWSDMPDNIDLKTYKEVSNVSINKNRALRSMMQNGCDHIFLCEDDITFTDRELCRKYINTAEESGIWHLNHGEDAPSNTLEYDSIDVDFYTDMQSKWTYFHRNIITHIGYLDERFNVNMSGKDHTYRICKAGLHPPFGLFADCSNSGLSISDTDKDKTFSVIDYKSVEGIKAIQDSYYLFLMKNQNTPEEIKLPPQSEIDESLQMIQTNYSRKVL